MLVYIFREGTSRTSLYRHISDSLSRKEKHDGGFHREWWNTRALARQKRQVGDGKGEKELPSKKNHQNNLKSLGENQIAEVSKFLHNYNT